jgi:hypothetical protein
MLEADRGGAEGGGAEEFVLHGAQQLGRGRGGDVLVAVGERRWCREARVIITWTRARWLREQQEARRREVESCTPVHALTEQAEAVRADVRCAARRRPRNSGSGGCSSLWCLAFSRYSRVAAPSNLNLLEGVNERR